MLATDLLTANPAPSCRHTECLYQSAVVTEEHPLVRGNGAYYVHRSTAGCRVFLRLTPLDRKPECTIGPFPNFVEANAHCADSMAFTGWWYQYEAGPFA